MKHLILTLFIATISILSVQSQSTWKVDPAHSNIEFIVKHMVIFDVRGQFNEYDVTVNSRRDDFTNADVQVSVNVQSIDTDNDRRDGHLRSDDFFDAENHPRMTFKSKSLRKVGDKYQLAGDLTIRGNTKEVTLDVKHLGTITDPWGNQRAGFTVTGEINRFDFGLRWNDLMEAGGAVVGETVRIECNVQLVKQ